MKSPRNTTRRTVLQSLGAGTVGGVVIVAGTGGASGRGRPRGAGRRTWGERNVVEVEGGEDGLVRTYAITSPDQDEQLSSLGVHINSAAMCAYSEGGAMHKEADEAHLHFPEKTANGTNIDLHQFTFNGFHYNPEGHPPPGVYTVPHFDFHFYMMDEDDVADIPFGVAAYDIPKDQIPDEYVFGDPRIIEAEMGEHLLDSTSPEIAQWDEDQFTHTYIYGAYDTGIDPDSPDGWTGEDEGDGLPIYVGNNRGQLHFVEPMVTVDFIGNRLEEETAVSVATPEAFSVADEYPTKYVMKPDGEGGVFISIDGFETFPSSGP